MPEQEQNDATKHEDGAADETPEQLDANGMTAEERAAMLADAEKRAADPHTSAVMKAWFRQNIRWVIAELDFVRHGHDAEKRAELNP